LPPTLPAPKRGGSKAKETRSGPKTGRNDKTNCGQDGSDVVGLDDDSCETTATLKESAGKDPPVEEEVLQNEGGNLLQELTLG
jgi:hypothetical protein